MMLIDTHCHIFSEEFATDRESAIQRALEVGVSQILMPNIDADSISAMMELHSTHPSVCLPMMGLHPCYVKEDFEQVLMQMESLLSQHSFVAIGEIGTDLYWDKTFWSHQQEAFKIQVGWAKKHKLPIAIHCRESFQETLALLEPLVDEYLTGVFHCFTGNAQDADRVKEMGFYLGIGGVATFKKGGMDTVIPQIGLERVVLETDSPYLAPVPYRGKRNEPAYLALIAQKVADYLAIPVEEVASITTQNARQLFPRIYEK
ncbi:TatD family hydrolase [Cytophagales bacterium LB-30]|uniref:TatD family hydrolase n=1 Tax=Shiella aurantiaca TaxID=3058365 RepID=A0ABT8F1T1_9BACT|nr:TatD family hydrolase [Shiella aurantiaca]MDN4164387.1 TatD family hydrolase [Shiella aurantiaca]